jgi:hypothetical protein
MGGIWGGRGDHFGGRSFGGVNCCDGPGDGEGKGPDTGISIGILVGARDVIDAWFQFG